MKPFLDTGFLLTLLFDTGGSEEAWRVARTIDAPLSVATFQIFSTENRILRQLEASESNTAQRRMAANALQNFRWYLEQEIFEPIHFDYEIAIELAVQWQKRKPTLPALLILWPAIAATIGASVFLSFDPRTRQLAKSAGLKVLPEKL